MTPGIIWTAAAVLYLLFRLWYDHRSGPLVPAEIEQILVAIHDRLDGTGNNADVLRAFLEADDGREFLMVNLVKIQPGPMTDSRSGEQLPGSVWFRRYARRFMRVLLRYGGHPALVGRKVGGYVDAWNVAPDPGWTIFGLVRYRSRRDLMRLVLDPAFKDAHPEKLLGTLATFSFPAQPMAVLYPGPRVTVALVLALVAAFAHLAWVVM